MATNTDIKRVLKRYQSSAEKGLHGPSSYMSTESSDVSRKPLSNSSGSGCGGGSSSTHDKAQVHFKKVWASSLNPQQTSRCCVTSEQQTLPSKCHPDNLCLSSLKAYQHTIYSSSYHHPSPDRGKSHQQIYHEKDNWDYKYHQQQQACDAGEPPSKCHRLSASVIDGKLFHHRLHKDDDEGFDLEKKAAGGTGSYPPSSKCCGGDDPPGDKWVLEKHSTGGHPHHHGDAGSGGGDIVVLTGHHVHPGNVSPRSSYGGWADVGAFTPPSPYSPPNSLSLSSPPQMPFPLVMGPADEYGGKGEALLEGEMVACFSVGGERRLCFPQVLNASLKEFSLPQINAQNQALHIYLSYCSSRQLQCLKEDDVLPPTVKSCGLITFSDAHRLTHALLHANAPSVDPPKTLTLPYNSSTRQFSATTPLQMSVNSHSTNRHIPNIIISHRCFGKCRGWVYLSLYDHPEAACIQCCECRAFYTPTQFVCHAHRSLENRTCHWGFDPANWRIYLQLASDQPLQPVGSSLPQTATLPEVYLEQFKIKFDPARQRQASEAHHHHHQQQQHPVQKHASSTSSPGPSILTTSSRPASRTIPTPTSSFSTPTSVITLDATPRPASTPHDDTTTVNSFGGASVCSGGEAGGGCLPSLSVPSKDGNTFAAPPAALVRESMPAPLPPKLQSKGPPVLIDPGHVVPLSQYDKFKNCQPNVTLAPPLQKSCDSEDADPTEASTASPASFAAAAAGGVGASCKDASAAQSFVAGKPPVGGRKDSKNRGESEVYTAVSSSSKYDREKVALRTMGGETKGYTISLCQTYKPQSVGSKYHNTLSNARECLTSEVLKRYTTSPGSDSSGYKNITDQRGCPILSNELKLLSVDRSVVPKDLQIIKLDPSVRSGERHIVQSCRTSGSSQCSVSKSLRILKVEPSSGSEATPKQEVLDEEGQSGCRNTGARVPPERRHSNSAGPAPPIKLERFYSDEGTTTTTSGGSYEYSQDQWRHTRSATFTTRRPSHGSGTVQDEERECDVSGEDQSMPAASSYSGEREATARRKLSSSSPRETTSSSTLSSSSSSSSSLATTSKRSGVISDSVCCYISSGNSNNKHNSNNIIKSSNNKEASCSGNSSKNNHHGTTHPKEGADGDVVASCSRDIKHEPSQVDTALFDDGDVQEPLSCSVITGACHNRSGVRNSAAPAMARASAVRSGGGVVLGRSPKERWSLSEVAPEAASAVSEAEAILQQWEDKDSASRVTALIRSLVPLSVLRSDHRRRSPARVEEKDTASHHTENGEDVSGGGEGSSWLSVGGNPAESEESGEKLRHSTNEDGAPRQQQSSPSTMSKETNARSPDRDDDNNTKCNHYRASNISDKCNRKSSPSNHHLPNESCKPREKKSKDGHCVGSNASSSSIRVPSDRSRTPGSEPCEAVSLSNNTANAPDKKLDDCCSQPSRDQNSPERPTKVGSPQQCRDEGMGTSSPSRGNGAFATNAAVKRQHRDSTDEAPSQVLEAKVRNLESELARVMAELSCYKKIKIEPADDTNSSMTTTSTVRDHAERHHRKERQRRHHLSTKDERRRERMRHRELAAAAVGDERNSQHRYLQQQEHAGDRDSISNCSRSRDDDGSADEGRRHKSRERWRRRSSLPSRRHDDEAEGEQGEIDPMRIGGKEQHSKSSRREHSEATELGDPERGDRRSEEEENREASRPTCTMSSSSSPSSEEVPQHESVSESTAKAAGSTNERHRDRLEETEGGDALKKHKGTKEALRREPPKP